MTNQKSPEMKVMEWLHDHGYGHIHQEWYDAFNDGSKDWMYKHSIQSWLKEKYPAIYREYTESKP